MIESILLFLLGSFIGHVLPRFPVLLLSRGRGFNLHFPPHPESMPLGPHLNQRVLHMRTFYWLGLVVALIPLIVGIISVRWGNAAFGFGLWLSAGWFALNRLQSLIGGQKPPWTRAMAEELQGIINVSRSETACCSWAVPVWDVTKVRCDTCNKTLRRMPRPDLGRKRSDGRLLGMLRLLISDGYPMVSALEEE